MPENEYVATAAAEKRLREVLAEAFGNDTIRDRVAQALLHGAKIEYKSRAKQVVISIDLPDTATTPKPKDDDGSTGSAEYGAPPEPETTQAPPQPHIAPFAPKIDPDADYEDVHYD